jgi:hypothetical protein
MPLQPQLFSLKPAVALRRGPRQNGYWAPTSTTYEHWVTAGKPCFRHGCGHRHGNHIPSEGMECNECDCLGFVGFADSSRTSSTGEWARS